MTVHTAICVLRGTWCGVQQRLWRQRRHDTDHSGIMDENISRQFCVTCLAKAYSGLFCVATRIERIGNKLADDLGYFLFHDIPFLAICKTSAVSEE